LFRKWVLNILYLRSTNGYKALKETLGDVEPLLFKDAVHPTQATSKFYGLIHFEVAFKDFFARLAKISLH
jgi:hypothetical protein